MPGVDVSAVSAVLVAAVFAVSGSAKLLDRRGTREAVEALGVPAFAAGVVAAALAPVELVLAGALLPPPTGRVAAMAAALLLLTFTVVVVINLLLGRRPSCGCFGGLGSSDVSWRTVVRNLLLLGAAGLATLPREALSPAAVALGFVSAGALVATEQAFSRRAAVAVEQQQLDDLEMSMNDSADRGPAPAFVLPDLEGTEVSLEDLLAPGRPLLLVFLNTGCGSCRQIAPAVRRWHEDYADRLTVAAVVRGTADQTREGLGDLGTVSVLLSADGALAETYAVAGIPGGALIAADGRLSAPAAGGSLGVRRLLAAALEPVAAVEEGTSPDLLNLSARPAPRATVTVRHSDGATVLVDEATGASLSLDVLGGLVWQCLDGASSLGEIADDLADVFEADPEAVSPDVLRFVRTCGAHGLLVGIAAQPLPVLEPAEGSTA